MKNKEEILLERAKIHSIKNFDSTASDREITQYVEFSLYSQKYAFKERFVSEVLTLKEITPIPGTPSFVLGVMNIRGKILSVINIHKLFNLPDKGLTELNKVIILENENNYFGVIADSILGIRDVDLSTVPPPPVNSFGPLEMEFVYGILPDGLVLLKGRKMLISTTLIIKQ